MLNYQSVPIKTCNNMDLEDQVRKFYWKWSPGQLTPVASGAGATSNVGLMAAKAEEYGSHDKTFVVPEAGAAGSIDGPVRCSDLGATHCITA